LAVTPVATARSEATRLPATPRSLNPLACTGTALPPNLLLIAKLIALGLLLKGYVPRIPGVFLPMWAALDLLPEPELVRLAMQATVVTAGVCLLCNRAVRTCAFLIGGDRVPPAVASRDVLRGGAPDDRPESRPALGGTLSDERSALSGPPEDGRPLPVLRVIVT
jgi:hypothetical protein